MNESSPALCYLRKRKLSPGKPKRLFFLGIKHSGKSSAAWRSSFSLGWEYRDSDETILSFAGNTYPSVREFYRRAGKDLFMKTEYQAVSSLLEIPEDLCAALGGGACDNPELMELCRSSGILLFLDTPPLQVYERIMEGGLPPFLSSDDPWGSFLKLYDRRSAAYREHADVQLKLGNASLDEVTAFLEHSLDAIIARYYGRK